MVGGGYRRADGPLNPSVSNGFAALAGLRRKKKYDKEKGSSQATKEEKPPMYPAPAPSTVKSWADVGDEDDYDYYATTLPPRAIWGKPEESETSDPVEESESEDELLDEGDDDLEEDHNHEQEGQEQPETIMQKPVEVSPAPKESERQLSKKEMRKKDLAEFEAILANFGVSLKEKAEEEPSDVAKEIKDEGVNGDSKNKDPPSAESKSAKKKKRKDKARKEVKKSLLFSSSDSPDRAEETPETKQVKEDTSAAAAAKLKVQLMKPLSTKKKKKSKKEIDAAVRYCRLVAAFTSRLRGSSARGVRIWLKSESLLYRKRKSNEEIEAAARAACVEEAAARSAKLAAAKKKEKNHFNQQPTR